MAELSPEDDERLRRQELSRGAAAESLAQNEAFVAALQHVRDGIWLTFQQSGMDDVDVWRSCRLKLDLLDDLGDGVIHILQTGRMAQQQLAEMERRKRPNGEDERAET